MDWGFLVGFTLGSIGLFVYHIWWLHALCTSNKGKFALYRKDMFQMMIEFGEIVDHKREK